MPISLDERLEILQKAARAWLDLKKAIDGLTDAELERPNSIGSWSGRDVMMHVAIWDEELLRVLTELDAGMPETWPDTATAEKHDAWNEEMVANFRDMPLDEAKAFFEDVHFELMDVMEQSPDLTERLSMESHYAHHIGDVRALKAR